MAHGSPKTIRKTLISLGEAVLRRLARISMVGSQKGAHLTRYYMYERLSRVLPSAPREGLVLSISESRKLCSVLGLEHLTVVEANYPEYDMLALPFPDNTFDYVVSDQVLEHVEGSPGKAIWESYRVLKSGGIAVHTTCLINPIHHAPKDLWRFTPDGLRWLCRGFSEIIECGGWGNPYVWIAVRLGLRFEAVPHAKWHPLHWLATLNFPEWPIVVWIAARK